MIFLGIYLIFFSAKSHAAGICMIDRKIVILEMNFKFASSIITK